MRLGHSLLLQEYVAATEVDYGDCAAFQITCPICHEAIFKAGKYGSDRQYFSHYAASKSNVDDCELRVANISEDHVRVINAQGHAQMLSAFFENFRGPVVKWLAPTDFEKVRRQVTWMAVRPSYIVYSAWLSKTTSYNDLDKLWRQTIEGMTEALPESAYWIEQQKRFANDFLQHLLAPNSQSAWHFITALALFATSKLDNDRYRTLVFGTEQQVKKLFIRLRETPLTSEREIEYAQRHVRLLHHRDYSQSHILAVTLLCSICTLLLCIPYVDLVGEEHNEETRKRNREYLLSLI